MKLILREKSSSMIIKQYGIERTKEKETLAVCVCVADSF
jgi:hypothetical protein